MTVPSQDITHDQWRAFEETLLRFESAWRDRPPPDLEAFLPESECVERSYLLNELIMIDIEYRWQRGDQVTVESYGERYPELLREGCLPIGLIREELRARRSANQLPTRAVLRTRFPDQYDQIAPMLDQPATAADDSSQVDDTTDASTIASASKESTELQTRLPILRNLGRYEIIRRAGRGSFAHVYHARDPQLGRDVAIKVPRAGVVDIPELRERFFREACAAAALNHPGIVPIFEVGESNEQLFIVSEFVAGQSLDELLRDDRHPEGQLVDWLIQISQAVHYAHQCGLVHRDLKPANIMVTADGLLRLTDFGLAQQEDAGATLTREGDIVGTPAYMSPEQARGDGHSVDARSDVYSLGVLMYRMLTGRLPFEGTSASVLRRVISEPPAPPRRWRRTCCATWRRPV